MESDESRWDYLCSFGRGGRGGVAQSLPLRKIFGAWIRKRPQCGRDRSSVRARNAKELEGGSAGCRSFDVRNIVRRDREAATEEDCLCRRRARQIRAPLGPTRGSSWPLWARVEDRRGHGDVSKAVPKSARRLHRRHHRRAHFFETVRIFQAVGYGL